LQAGEHAADHGPELVDEHVPEVLASVERLFVPTGCPAQVVVE
jgi:hypothetical protein